MEVILLEKIHRLGELGECVKVKPGYARNYLLSQKKAVLATPENRETFEKQRKEFEKKAAESLKIAQSVYEKINNISINIDMLASEGGKLYGSVSVNEIVSGLQEAGYEIEKQQIVLPQGPIREVGEHEVHIQLHSELNATIKVIVQAGMAEL
jgi:large subunit ribosomal protein L9